MDHFSSVVDSYPECRGERDYMSEISAEQLEGLRLFTQTQLLVFLTEGFSLLREQPFQFCNANKVFLTHGRFIMRPWYFYNIVSTLRRDVFG